MYFNVDRIAVLAGLDRSGSSGLMREGVKPMPGGTGTPVAPSKQATPPAPKAATPAPKATPPAPTKAAAGRPAMEEEDKELDEMYDEGAYEEGMYEDDMVGDAMEGMYMDDMGLGGMGGMGDEEMYMDEMGHGHDHSKETVYEIDEMQLMEALVDMREQRLEEGKFRSKVRREISDVLNEMESGSRWIYGNKRPSNSGKGSVAKGFLGPGFR